MPIYKVFIAGAEGAGKTELIKTISDLPLVSIEKKVPTTNVILPMDYGRIRIDRNMIYFYSAPNCAQIMWLWRVLGSEMDGCLIAVDSTNQSLIQSTRALVRCYSHRSGFLGWPGSLPHVIVANKVDLEEAVSLTQLRRMLRLTRASVILPCIGTQRSSVMMVVTELVRMLTENKK